MEFFCFISSFGIGFSRRSSFEYGEGSKESEIVVLKERRLIPVKPVKEGMQRFSFLLEVCVPGTVPDPQLIGAIMDLVSLKFSRITKKNNKNVSLTVAFSLESGSAKRTDYCTRRYAIGMCELCASMQSRPMAKLD